MKSDSQKVINQRTNLEKFFNLHAGQRCVIIGNGPSLKKMDLSFLKNEITFCSNRIYLGLKDFDFSPSYYVCVDPLVIEQSYDEIKKIQCPKFISEFGKKFIPPDDKTYFLNSLSEWAFSVDPKKGIFSGSTVVFACLQLAYYMGFTEVILIGVDHQYDTIGKPNQEVISQSEDVDHFSTRYFSIGTRWHYPDLENAALNFHLANLFYALANRKIFDATIDGKLFEFPKVDYKDHFTHSKKENFLLKHSLETDQIDEKVIDKSQKRAYKISAIVSTYRGEKFLRDCLMDLESQSNQKEVEVIVVDSGSDQNEKEIVEEFQTKFDNIVYIRTEKKETIYAAWNRGIRHARGCYITNANVDDRHDPEAYTKLAHYLDENKDIALVYADVAITKKENSTLQNAPIEGYYLWSEFHPESLFLGCYVGPQPLWRKELHDKYGFFDPLYTSAGDYEFWLRVSKSEIFFHLPETLGLYYFSTSSAEHRNGLISYFEQEQAKKTHLPPQYKSIEEIRKKFNIDVVINKTVAICIARFSDLYRRGEYLNALDCLNNELQKDTCNPILLNLRGELLMRLGNYSAANRDFAVTRLYHPKYLPAIYNQAISLSYVGRVKESIWLIKVIIEQNPTFLPAIKSLMKLYFRIGEEKKALDVAQNYLQKAPKDLETRCYLAEYFLRKNEISATLSFYKLVFSETFDFLALQDSLHAQGLSHCDKNNNDHDNDNIPVSKRFESIINSENLIETLNQHENWLDKDLYIFVDEKISEAQNLKLLDVEKGLINLKEYIRSVIKKNEYKNQ